MLHIIIIYLMNRHNKIDMINEASYDASLFSFSSIICETIATFFASLVCNFVRHNLLSFIYWEICRFL